MSKSKRQAPGDQLRRAFAAATSDLKPGGRLPKGMEEPQAGRAVLAYCGLQLQRFATAGEKMLAVLEDTEPEPEGGWQDEPPASLHVEHPGMPEIPAGQMNPEKIAALIEEQDQETCRKFAIVMLGWLEARTDIANMRETVEDLIRDLRAEEVGAVEMVRDCYRTALGLDADDDQADDEQEHGRTVEVTLREGARPKRVPVQSLDGSEVGDQSPQAGSHGGGSASSGDTKGEQDADADREGGDDGPT